MIGGSSDMLFCILLVTGNLLWKHKNVMDHPTRDQKDSRSYYRPKCDFLLK